LRFSDALKAAAIGGLVAGLVDIGTAALIGWQSPLTMLHAIASGIEGRAAYHGGLRSALIGLGLQALMSIAIAAIYNVAAAVAPGLRRHWILGGIGAGPVIFIGMNYLVLPLSRAWPKPHFTPISVVPDMAAMLLFGLVVAFFARRR
jgi:hypothetical protein